jgi:hypothetical protein
VYCRGITAGSGGLTSAGERVSSARKITPVITPPSCKVVPPPTPGRCGTNFAITVLMETSRSVVNAVPSDIEFTPPGFDEAVREIVLSLSPATGIAGCKSLGKTLLGA